MKKRKETSLGTDRAGSETEQPVSGCGENRDRHDSGAGSISVFTEVFCNRYYTWIGKRIRLL